MGPPRVRSGGTAAGETRRLLTSGPGRTAMAFRNSDPITLANDTRAEGPVTLRRQLLGAVVTGIGPHGGPRRRTGRGAWPTDPWSEISRASGRGGWPHLTAGGRRCGPTRRVTPGCRVPDCDQPQRMDVAREAPWTTSDFCADVGLPGPSDQAQRPGPATRPGRAPEQLLGAVRAVADGRLSFDAAPRPMRARRRPAIVTEHHAIAVPAQCGRGRGFFHATCAPGSMADLLAEARSAAAR